jgi:hypothetical protein
MVQRYPDKTAAAGPHLGQAPQIWARGIASGGSIRGNSSAAKQKRLARNVNKKSRLL